MGGKSVRTLLDTGATISCVSQAHAIACGSVIKPNFSPIQGIGGQVTPIGTTAVKFGRFQSDQQFVVVRTGVSDDGRSLTVIRYVMCKRSRSQPSASRYMPRWRCYSCRRYVATGVRPGKRWHRPQPQDAPSRRPTPDVAHGVYSQPSSSRGNMQAPARFSDRHSRFRGPLTQAASRPTASRRPAHVATIIR